MSGTKFALGLYSVRKGLAEDMEGTLRAVAAMGYKGVEFFGGFRFEADRITRILKETGLALVGWHTAWDALQGDAFTNTVAFFKEIGNRNVIVPGLPEGMLSTREACLETARQFNALAEKLAAEDMRLGYHNHASELKFYEGTADCPFTVFFDHTDLAVIVQMDNGNALSGGGPGVLSLLRRYPDRYRTIHLKPYSMEKGAVNPAEGFEVMIGEDDIPWMDFLYQCKATGGTEWFIVEFESERLYPELEGVARNLKALLDMQAQGRI